MNDSENELELTFKSPKALADFLLELNKGTNALSKHITSLTPSIDFPSFIIKFLKHSTLSQKYGKFGNFLPQAKNAFQQNSQKNRGLPRIEGPLNLNQPPLSFSNAQFANPNAQAQPFAPYFPQQLCQGMNPRIPIQLPSSEKMTAQNFNQLGNWAFFNKLPKIDKSGILFNTAEDLKGNKQIFENLQKEQKQQIYKRLILQRIKEIPEIVKQFFKKRGS